MIVFHKKLWLIGLLFISLFPQPVKSQSVSPATDGTGTVINQNGNIINITGGTLSQDQINLFHSFSQFGLNQSEIANFLSNPNIKNILGRIVGGDRSIINGLIQVTGGNSNLFLINPSGIIFGANAQLNVPASFTATTATGIGFGNNLWFNANGLNNYTTLVGDPNQFAFNINQPGSIINAGSLQVGTGQNISLIGGNVINTGTLTAPEGNIAIVSVPGSNIVKISQPGHLLSLEINPTQTSAPTDITALSLPQLLTGGNVNQATGVTVNANGEVILTSSGVIVPADGGVSIASGNLNVAGTIGGKVNVLGEKVGVIGSNINASGANGGGTVLIGGDFQGKGTIPNAQSTLISADSTINANASISGNAGKVIIWADKNTHFYGNIDAQGGSISGNGGFVEVSGKQFLDFDGSVNTLAANGNVGTLLLDPTDINIVASGGNASLANVSAFANPNTDVASSDINAELINNANSNVVLQATGSISFQTPINISQSGVGLTAQANDYIILSDITTNGGSLNITADIDNNGIGSIQDGYNYSLITNGGDINLQGGGASFDSSIELDKVTVNSGGGNITLTGVNNAGTGFQAINIFDSSSISSGGGNITLNGTGDGTGIFIQNASLNSAGGNITLNGHSINQEGIYLEGVSINSGIGNFTLTADSTDIALANSFVGTGNLIIQPQTPSLGMTIGGGGASDTTFLNSAELGSFANGFNSITIGRNDSSGVISFAGNTTFNDPVTLRSPIGNGTINTQSFDIIGTDNANITLLANRSIIANNITSLGGNFQATSGNINIKNIDVNDSTSKAAGSINITATNGNLLVGNIKTNADSDFYGDTQFPVAGNITLSAPNGKITAGNIEALAYITDFFSGDGGAVSISALDDIQTGTINTLSGAGFGGQVDINSNNGGISTNDILSLSYAGGGGRNITLLANNGNISTGNLEAYGNFTRTGGVISLTSQTISTKDIVTDNNNIILNGKVALAQDVTITNRNSSGNITFNNTVNSSTNSISPANILIESGTGTVSFQNTVGNTKVLGNIVINSTGITQFNSSVNAANLTTDSNGTTQLNGNVTTTGTQTYNDAVTFAGNSILTGNGGISFNSTLTGTGNLTVDVGSNNFTLSNDINIGTGNLTLNSTGTTSLKAITAGSLTTNAGGTTQLNGNITTTGTQTYNDAVNGGNLTLDSGSGNITFTNAATFGDLTLNSPGTTSLQAITAKSLTTNAGGTTLLNGNVTTIENQTYNDTVTVIGNLTLTGDEINFGNTISGTGDLTLQPFTPTQNINIGGISNIGTNTLNLLTSDIAALQDGFNSITIGRVDGSGIISLTGNTTFLDPLILRSPSGTIFINNSINTPSITFDTTTFIGGDITTTNPQTYNYPVIFTNDSTITSNGITFNNTINGNKNLTINSGISDVIFSQALGNIEPLANININSSGKTFFANVNAANITTDTPGITQLNGNLTATGSNISNYGNIILNDAVSLTNNTTLTAANSININNINGNYNLIFNAGGDINFNNDLGNNITLGNLTINQAANVTGKNINAASITQTSGQNTTLGNLTTNQGGVNLRTNQNITIENITANAQEITLNSPNITTKNLNSSSINGGGNINILAQNQIITGKIDSSSTIGNGGNVTIDPITTIIDSINAQGGTNGFGGDVDIMSLNTFRAIGTFIDRNGIIASISTAGGLGGGDITIYHPGVIPFSIGNADIQGTAGAITSGINNSIIPQREFLSNYTQDNIRILSLQPIPESKPPIIDNNPESLIIGNLTDPGKILTSSEFGRQAVSNQLNTGNIEGAVSSVEQFLSGEYTGYYGEALPLDAQPQTTETIQDALIKIAKQTGKRSAIVYMIAETDSLELIVIMPSGKATHQTVKISKKQLISDIKTFRNQVTNLLNNNYKQSGEKVYRSLIAPIEAILKAEKIDTLLFSVDSNLRSLPFAALYDGKNYLAEKYSMALIPSVTLMDTRYQSLQNSQVLLMGASKFINPNQSALPGVMVELPTVAKEFGENKYFINNEFTISNLQKQRQERPTQIVHLATHGEFNPGDSSQSYIQFWENEKLQINQIRNLGFRKPPVELLVLSACRTALGNEQVELGFAGLAVQAGVKSALASLWYVSDEGTLGLMNEFYQKLRSVPIKSEALRQAQIAMIQGKVTVQNGEIRSSRGGISLPPQLIIKNQNLSHPYYWAAFTMIGSPW